jgi:hypothetical protein
VTAVLLAGVALVLAAVPALLFVRNLGLYRPAPPYQETSPCPAVSVLIPARNEERSIVAAVESALASRGVDIEVVVLDDHSEDCTGELVAELERRDPRVRLVPAPPLPDGWCGKQHACWVLGQQARKPLLLFLDADVRLGPEGLARLVRFLDVSRADLVSGIPHQETGTWLEKLVIPLIHFILLGFLPLARMRKSRGPAFAAGCGQLFLARRDAYEKMGGHAVIRTTLHDGLRLPRAFRAAGLMTDLCDATDLARCRMYRGAAELWRGLAKNATEGLAAGPVILPASVLLAGGQILPMGLALVGPWLDVSETALMLALGGTFLGYLPRVLAAFCFGQSWSGAALHPLGVAVLLAIQWYAWLCARTGRRPTWKGRAYTPRGSG